MWVICWGWGQGTWEGILGEEGERSCPLFKGIALPIGSPGALSLWGLLALGPRHGQNLWKNILHQEGEMDWDYEPSQEQGLYRPHVSGAQAGPCRADDQQLAPGSAVREFRPWSLQPPGAAAAVSGWPALVRLTQQQTCWGNSD